MSYGAGQYDLICSLNFLRGNLGDFFKNSGQVFIFLHQSLGSMPTLSPIPVCVGTAPSAISPPVS